MSSATGPRPGRPGGGRGDTPQNIATAIAEVSERAATLVHEEIELAKTEFAEKTASLMRGAIVAAAAGVFVLMAVILALVGGAWLLYYYLPGATFAYFWGFFAMAALLLVSGALAGLLAWRIVKRSAPPVPTLAIDEAKKIRDTVSGAPEPAVGLGPGVGVPPTGPGPFAAPGPPPAAAPPGAPPHPADGPPPAPNGPPPGQDS